jgi:anti-sigma B factor antagonist
VDFSASVNRDGGVATIVVSGEIDIATSPTIYQAISQALLADDVDTVLVDLAGVRFLDSSGISVLLQGRRLADGRAVRYRVVRADNMVRRILELTGVWEHLSGDPNQAAEA